MAVNVATCKVNPVRIALGGATQLIVTLDQPAPPGGITVAIDAVYDGSADTFVGGTILQSLGFDQGSSAAYYTLQTQIVDNAATKVTFLAYIGSGAAKSAELQIG